MEWTHKRLCARVGGMRTPKLYLWSIYSQEYKINKTVSSLKKNCLWCLLEPSVLQEIVDHCTNGVAVPNGRWLAGRRSEQAEQLGL